MRSLIIYAFICAVLQINVVPAIADETAAAIEEAERPDVFAGFNEEMAKENVGKESGDIEFPVDWKTFSELEATARGEAREREIKNDRERFGSSPKRERSMREREANWERQIRERVGPPALIQEAQRERDLLFSNQPDLRHAIPGHPGGILAPTPLLSNRYSSWGTNEALRIIDEQQDIRQDIEDEDDPEAYGRAKLLHEKREN
jgi:hypothetical protein